MRTAPLVIISMSKGSSSPTSPSRPVLALEQEETVVPVSHVLSLQEVSASFEALNLDIEKKPNVVHRAQTSYSPGASGTPGSQAYGTTRGPHQSRFKSQRGMPSRYG